MQTRRILFAVTLLAIVFSLFIDESARFNVLLVVGIANLTSFFFREMDKTSVLAYDESTGQIADLAAGADVETETEEKKSESESESESESKTKDSTEYITEEEYLLEKNRMLKERRRNIPLDAREKFASFLLKENNEMIEKVNRFYMPQN